MYVKDILRRGSCWWCWWRCWWWYFPSAHLPCIRTLLCPSWWPVFLGDATTVPGKFAVCPGDGELESFWGVTMMILWIQNAMFGLEIFNQPKSDGDLTKITREHGVKPICCTKSLATFESKKLFVRIVKLDFLIFTYSLCPGSCVEKNCLQNA